MSLTPRQEAEAIEQFGEDLAKLVAAFCTSFSNATTDRVCAVPNQEHLEQIAADYIALGDAMCRELDEVEEADDRRRANPLEPDHRRL